MYMTYDESYETNLGSFVECYSSANRKVVYHLLTEANNPTSINRGWERLSPATTIHHT